MSTPTGPSTPETTPASTAGAASAQAIIEQAKRLGLTWEIRLATITTVSTDGMAFLGVYDNDIQPIPMISLTKGVAAGYRVYVISVPPQGNYIIGFPRGGPANNNAQITATGSTNSAAFSNYPGFAAITMPKLQSATGLLVRWAPSFFTDNAATGPEFGVQITVNGVSTDYVTHNLPGTLSVNVRLPSFGEKLIPNVAAGALTITGRWRRFGGAGTINAVNGADYASLTADEV